MIMFAQHVCTCTYISNDKGRWLNKYHGVSQLTRKMFISINRANQLL